MSRSISTAAALVLMISSLVLGYMTLTAWMQPEIVIEWTTATELDVAGFNLYRATSPDGPFEIVNDHIIAPAVDPLTGGDYSFTDDNVEAGTTYFYNLEEIELSGFVSINGPIEVSAKGLNILNAVGTFALLLAGIWTFKESRSNSDH